MQDKFIGICLGASTISFVRLAKNGNSVSLDEHFSVAHNGDPKSVLIDNIRKFNSDKFPTVVTGRKFRKFIRLTSVSEPEASEIAFNYVKNNNDDFIAIASLGGETFMVYTLDKLGKISNVITKNQCASGTGEFFLQQIKRMDLTIDEVGTLDNNVEPYKVSGRCSVFCKSDCTHALNKGIPKAEVTSGLALMMAEKVEELLQKVKDGKILVVGGVTKNNKVMDYLRQKHSDMVIPDEATYFEALGAALYAAEHEVRQIDDFEDIFDDSESSFIFHKPLAKFKDKVVFKTHEHSTAKAGDTLVLGLDVGSTTTKAVLIDYETNAIVASVYLYTYGNPVEAARNCYRELLKQVPDDVKIIGLGTTGSGRQIAGLHALTDGIINEIVAHATAAVYFDSDVDTIFEIGGQDAKYTYIVNKVPADYAMNEACSAGTGSFIEEAAYESLGVKVEDIENIAMKADRPPNFSDQCAAFISSDIKTAQNENISKTNIIAGLVYSICMNYVNRVKGNRAVGNKVFMQGGVCYNKSIPIAMAALTGVEIIVPPDPGLMGAFGVALDVNEKLKLGLLQKKQFDLRELAERNVQYKKSFICMGVREKCDLRCVISNIVVNGKKYPFGGACNKYYNLIKKLDIDADKYDYVKKRNELMFGKYAPKRDLPDDAPVVGINQSFHTLTLYPLYYNFFTELGFKVIMPDEADEKGLEYEMTSFCYPAQMSLCLFKNLLEKQTDYLFVPEIFEMHVEGEKEQRLDFNCTCVFVSGEPFYLKQAYKKELGEKKIFTPFLNFSKGWEVEEDKFVEIAEQMGATKSKAINAYRNAVRMQRDFTQELFRMGDEFLEFLRKNPDEFAIVLIGRPYNSFTEFTNKGIPRKFASRGVYVIPYDMLNYMNEVIDDNQYWEGGKKILKAAKIVKREKQLFATYVSNFSCGPDSMLLTTFRTIMDTKPSLTLELDGHTADAGINTRIDAALDIIRNYRKLQSKLKDENDKNYTPADIIITETDAFFITSDGEKLKLTDNSIDILIPSMGDLAANIFAAALRSIGYNAIPLPEGNQDILKYGRANSSGKECLPLLLMVGSLVDYIENVWDGKQKVAFFIVQGAGNCRLGQYPVFMRNLIKRKKWRNVATLTLMNEDGFAGLGPAVSTRGIQALLISDVLDDVRSGIMAHAYEPEKGLDVFYNEFKILCDKMATEPKKIYKYLNKFANVIRKKVPARVPITKAKYIALTGEIYVRRDHFSHKWLNKQFAKRGFILKDSYISEWIFYVDYLLKLDLLEPDKSLAKKIERIIRTYYMRLAEYRVKKILAKTGYYKFELTNLKPILDSSKHVIPLEYKGEPGITLGVALHEIPEKYCGVINLGPFGCMPTRFTEAVSVPEMNIEKKIEAVRMTNPKYELPQIFDKNMNLPFLTIETDGNAYPQVIEARIETFALQAEKVAKLRTKAKMNGHG
jgi:predicted CoA-substrate-specific enzyme activase